MAGQVDESVDGVEVERLLGVEDDVDGGTSCVAGLLSCFAKLFSCCDDELVGDGAGGAKRKRSNEEADEDEDDESSGDSASLDPVAESTETAVSVEVSDSDEPAVAQAHAWLAELDERGKVSAITDFVKRRFKLSEKVSNPFGPPFSLA